MDLKHIEYLSPDAWNQWHTELLQSTLNRAYDRVSFYRKNMDDAGITPEDINSASDMAKLPFTFRRDLSDNYPYGLFSVPLRDIVRIHTLRSGQINPIALGHTRTDLKNRQQLTARFLSSCGVEQEDIVQICLDPGMALHGLDMREGAELIGALVIPPDPVSPDTRVKVMVDFKSTVLITTPSHGLFLMNKIREMEIPLASINLKRVIFLGEAISQQERERFQKELGTSTRIAYGIFEAAGPAMAGECHCHCGLHMAIDQIFPEIVDPETGAPLAEGQTGELVITTLRARANPLIRFRTGDITTLTKETCDCGRTTWRIAPISGQTDQVVLIRGVRISPEQIDNILEQAAGTAVEFLMVTKDWNHLRQMEVMVGITDALFSGCLPELHQWIRRVEELILNQLGIPCRISPVQPSSIRPFIQAGRRIISWEEWTRR